MGINLNSVHLTAAIFDMDGVVTDTAELHYLSWKEVFDHYLKIQSNSLAIQYSPFTKEDYLKYVDGVMRDDGIKNFLSSRDLFPEGEQEQSDLIHSLGKAKDDSFMDKVEECGVKRFESTIKLINTIKSCGSKIAVISSSKYCRKILEKAEVIDLFDGIVSGQLLVEKNIPGKPHPGIFLEAAKLISEPPAHCMVVEDALSGVKAGKEGGFGLVVGIDRNNIGFDRYLAHGADLAVNDLQDLPLENIRQWFSHHANTHI